MRRIAHNYLTPLPLLPPPKSNRSSVTRDCIAPTEHCHCAISRVFIFYEMRNSNLLAKSPEIIWRRRFCRSRTDRSSLKTIFRWQGTAAAPSAGCLCFVKCEMAMHPPNCPWLSNAAATAAVIQIACRPRMHPADWALPLHCLQGVGILRNSKQWHARRIAWGYQTP